MGISGKQSFAELSLTNKDTCPSLHTIWRCIAEIKNGCFELSKGKSPGRPVSTSTGPNIHKVKGLIEENCRLSCTEHEAITGIPKSTVHEILRNHLDLRNVYSFWVSHKLSDNNQAAKVSVCKELKKLFNAKRMAFMVSNYLVEDESWFLWDAPEYCRRAWIQKKAVKPTIANQKLTKRKTMVLIAFTCKPKGSLWMPSL